MKNLLIITSRYPHKYDEIGGVFVHSQVEELRKEFKKVVVISTTPYTPKVLTKWMEPKRKKDALAEDYSYKNVDVYYTKNVVLPLKATKKLKGVQGYRSAKKILKDTGFSPDIIHAHFSWPSGYVANELKKDFQVPVVLTVHEDHDWLLEEEKEEQIRKVWAGVDRIIRVNKLDLSMLKKYNKNTVCIPNGYLHKKFKPLEKSRCKKKLGLPKEKRIVFSLGKLIERKGYHDLIEAIRSVVKKENNILVIIGGDGPDRHKLENRIKEYNLGKHINLIGFVPEEDVPKWINASEFFILPSYSEGNPTVLFEALGCGRPFVGTTVGGVPEIIKNDDVGILFEPGDIKAMADSMVNSLNKEWDTELILGFSRHYTWENISKQVLEIYVKMCAR